MLLKTILPAFVAALSARAAPQLTTALPLDVVPDGSDPGDGTVLSGVIIGTGAGETTYVLSQPADGPSDIPVTATVVENASGLTANVVASSGDFIVSQSIACGFGDGTAVCTEAVVQASGTLTQSGSTIITGAPDIATLILSTSARSVPDSDPVAPSSSSQPSAANKFIPTAVFVNVNVLALAIMFAASA